MLSKRYTVQPGNEESPMYSYDPYSVRLDEIVRYLDEAMACEDMADLKLTIHIVDEEGFLDEVEEKYCKAVQMFVELMARDEDMKLREIEEEEGKTEEAKRALEEAEKELARQKMEALSQGKLYVPGQATQAWTESQIDLARQSTRLRILQALNERDGDLIAKAVEVGKQAKEQAERPRRFERDQAMKVAYCKELLQEGIAVLLEEKLENAIKTTHFTVHQTSILDNDEVLCLLYNRAKTEIEIIQKRKKEVAYCKELLQEGIAVLLEEKLENAIKTTHFTVHQTSLLDDDEVLCWLYNRAKNELEMIQKREEEKETREKKKPERRRKGREMNELNAVPNT